MNTPTTNVIMDVSEKTCIYLPKTSVWMYIPKKQHDYIYQKRKYGSDVSTKRNINMNIAISINNKSMDVSAKKTLIFYQKRKYGCIYQTN